MKFAERLAGAAAALLTHLLELPTEPARVGQEQLSEADHDRPSERVEEVRLEAQRNRAESIVDLWPAVEDVVDLQLHLRATEPRVLDRDLRNVAGIGKKAEIERRERREMQVVPSQRVDPRPATPIAAEPRAQSVIEIAGLRLDLMPRSAAALPLGITMKIVDHRKAGSDLDLVDES